MSSLLKVLQAFKKDAQYLPIAHLPLPTFKVKSGSGQPTAKELEEIKTTFETYEERFNKTEEEILARFDVALERIKVCAFINGFTNPFGLPVEEKHFKWCPHNAWKNHFRKSPFMVQ